MSTPNPAYFRRVDQMVRLAANHGIQIVMDAFETAGWMPVLEQNGIQKAFRYGKFLGNRYKNFNNIIWIIEGAAHQVAAASMTTIMLLLLECRMGHWYWP